MGDLPISGFKVSLSLRAKRFFCLTRVCSQQVFCERLPTVVRAGGRRTVRLSEALQHVSLLINAEVGSRLLGKLGIHASPDVLLRCARQSPSTSNSLTGRVIGVDDWALRKGHNYGTIIVDHEQRRTLALLPNRDGTELRAWLEQHPEVEVITRDRSNAFAQACTQGAPQAVQVLDRWHLLQNLVSAFERSITRHYASVKRATREIHSHSTEQVLVVESSPLPTENAATKTSARAHHSERFAAVKEKLQLGWSKARVAREFNLSRTTIHAYARFEEHAGRLPRRKRGSRLDPFKDYLKNRWAEGCINASLLYREIRQDGYAGGLTLVKDYVRKLRTAAIAKGVGVPPLVRVPSPRSLTWWLLLPERLDHEHRTWLNEVLERVPDLQKITVSVRSGWQALRERQTQSFLKWLTTIQHDGPTELRQYAKSLNREVKEAKAALELAWSNGATEGHVNRLKTIKRSMYGRAGFDLLAAKVLYQG